MIKVVQSIHLLIHRINTRTMMEYLAASAHDTAVESPPWQLNSSQRHLTRCPWQASFRTCMQIYALFKTDKSSSNPKILHLLVACFIRLTIFQNLVAVKTSDCFKYVSNGMYDILSSPYFVHNFASSY